MAAKIISSGFQSVEVEPLFLENEEFVATYQILGDDSNHRTSRQQSIKSPSTETENK